MAKDTKDASKNSLAARQERSYETRDQGQGRQSLMDWKSSENEIKFFEMEEGTHRLNIIPFRIVSDNHPDVKAGNAKIGNLDYMLDIWVHRFAGVNQGDFACLKHNYNRKCPICEESKRLRDEGDKDGADDLKASRRVYYNVLDASNPKEGIQVFETSYFLFEKELNEELKVQSSEAGAIVFADIEEGRIIKFRASPKKLGKQSFMEFKSFDFVERKQALSDEWIDEAIAFDGLLKVLSHDEMVTAFWGKDEEEDEDRPVKPTKRKGDDDEDEDPEVRPSKSSKRDDDDEDEPVRPSKSKKPVEDEDEPAEEDADGPVQPPRRNKSREPELEEE